MKFRKLRRKKYQLTKQFRQWRKKHEFADKFRNWRLKHPFIMTSLLTGLLLGIVCVCSFWGVVMDGKELTFFAPGDSFSDKCSYVVINLFVVGFAYAVMFCLVERANDEHKDRLAGKPIRYGRQRKGTML